MEFLLPWIIYLIDNIAVEEVGYGPSLWLGLVLLALFFVVFGFWTDGWDNTDNATASEKRGGEIFKSLRPWVITVTITMMVIGCLGRMVPTKDTSYKMLAAYGASVVVMDDNVQKYAKGSMKILDKALTDYLGEDWDKKLEEEGE
ncbi:hypothetical protein VPHD148_0174 [Vibrio phage D148]